MGTGSLKHPGMEWRNQAQTKRDKGAKVRGSTAYTLELAEVL